MPGAMPSLRGVEGSTAPPRGKEGSLSHERDRDGPIRMVLRRLAAQVCMNIIQQFLLLLVRLNNWISRIQPMYQAHD
jgi:hypothetical protein